MDKQFALILLLITLPKMWSYSQTIVLDSTTTYNAPETIVKNKTDTITKRIYLIACLRYEPSTVVVGWLCKTLKKRSQKAKSS